jgi:triosephosphate isomerase (TIM)
MKIARKPIIGGNWKMHTTLDSARNLAQSIASGASDVASAVDVVLFPPVPYMQQVGEILRGSPIGLGVQNAYPEKNGAFTGEIGLEMLQDLHISHVLIGHSERRHVIGESDELIRRKLRFMLDAGLNVVLCIGETLEQRERDEVEQVNLDQLDVALDGVPAEQIDRLIIAYEPVWAIGTGRTATPDDAQTVHRLIRHWLAGRYTEIVGDSIRIQYGGSVKPDNAMALFAQPDIDGFLVGGASLKEADFLAIVRAAIPSA